MRLLKIFVLLFTVANACAADQATGEKSETRHLSGAAFRKKWNPTDEELREIEKSKPPKIDTLGTLGELPFALEVDADVLEDPDQIDEQAKDLAYQVLVGDESALPALLAAIRLSGLHVRHGSRELVSPAGKSQGLVVEAWEVQAMGRLAREGFAVTLPDVARWIGGVFKAKDTGLLEQAILDAIRLRATADPGPVRFWGRFVVELGRQSPYHPIDLLAEGMSPLQVHFNAIQLALVLGRLGGDIWAYSNGKDKPAKRAEAPRAFHSLRSRESFFLLCSSSLSFANQTSAQSPPPSGTPCPGNQIDGTIGDATGVLTTFVHGSMLDRFLGKAIDAGDWGSFPIIGKAKRGLAIANTILAYLKLAMAYAVFDVEFTMEGPPPLLRTKTTQAGEQKQLKLRALMRTDQTDWINCLRRLLNIQGIDFALEKAGAIGGSTVSWRILAGEDIVGFYGGDPVHSKTDDQGNANIGIEGMPQKENLSKIASKITRRAVVNAQVNIKATLMAQDIVDGLGALAGRLLSVPVEVLCRTGFMFDRSYAFDVTDWTDNLTDGTNNLKFTFDSTMTESNSGGGSKYGTTGHFRAEVALKPDCEEEDNNECGDYWGRGTLEVAQPWTYTSPGESCTIKPSENVPVEVFYLSDVHELLFSFGMHTDKWSCSPGPIGAAWWWLQFQVFHHEELSLGPREPWYVWTAGRIPPAGTLVRKVFSRTQAITESHTISEDTTVEIRMSD